MSKYITEIFFLKLCFSYLWALNVENDLGVGKLFRLSVSAWNDTPPIEDRGKRGECWKKKNFFKYSL